MYMSVEDNINHLLQLPPSFLSSEIQLNSCTCKFWSVRFENGMDQNIMEHIFIIPLMNMLDEDLKLQVYIVACIISMYMY